MCSKLGVYDMEDVKFIMEFFINSFVHTLEILNNKYDLGYTIEHEKEKYIIIKKEG